MATFLTDVQAPLAELSTTEVARHHREMCAASIDYSYDGHYGLDLFRRAVEEHDEVAWAYLYEQYVPLVLAWVNRYTKTWFLPLTAGPMELVDTTFVKLWYSLDHGEQCFCVLSELMAYLHRCAHSTVAEELRVRALRENEQDLERVEFLLSDPADIVDCSLAYRELCVALLDEFQTEDERVIMILSLFYEMTPAEIYASWRGSWSNVQDVYRIKRNVLVRLLRSKRICTYLGERRSKKKEKKRGIHS